METIFDNADRREKIRQIESEIELDSFWTDNPQSQEIFNQLNQLKRSEERAIQLTRNVSDLSTGIELLNDEPDDEELNNEMIQLSDQIVSTINQLETELLLSHEWDGLNCIFSINAGAGGTDAQDWTEMLLRMYSRWFEKKGFQYELNDITPGDEAGIKSVTILIRGNYAYGLCKNEIGIVYIWC